MTDLMAIFNEDPYHCKVIVQVSDYYNCLDERGRDSLEEFTVWIVQRGTPGNGHIRQRS